MFIKGMYAFFLACFMVFPTIVSAEESAEEVEEILSWWNEYGKYWQAAEAEADDESLSIVLNNTSSE